jgi:hypothetical protein
VRRGGNLDIFFKSKYPIRHYRRYRLAVVGLEPLFCFGNTWRLFLFVVLGNFF